MDNQQREIRFFEVLLVGFCGMLAFGLFALLVPFVLAIIPLIGLIVGAILIRGFVRWMNERDSPQRNMRPPDES